MVCGICVEVAVAISVGVGVGNSAVAVAGRSVAGNGGAVGLVVGILHADKSNDKIVLKETKLRIVFLISSSWTTNPLRKNIY
jgi:hypothetical protein